MKEFFRITPVYDLLLRGSATTPVGLYHLQLATAAQLCRLHYSPGSLTTVKARLKTLVDHEYVQADGIPTKLFRSPYYYCMGQKGIRYLEEAGCDTSETFRSALETNKHALFIEHTLELNDIIISAALVYRDDPRYSLADLIHERVLKRHPYKSVWQRDGRQETCTVIPDAFLDFRLRSDAGQHRLPLLLEHDRGTEGQHYFKRRIRAYISLLTSGAHQQLFGVKAITIGFTTFKGEQRLQQMRNWTREELAGEQRGLGVTFCFAAISQPVDARALWLDRAWHTPYDDPLFALLRA